MKATMQARYKPMYVAVMNALIADIQRSLHQRMDAGFK